MVGTILATAETSGVGMNGFGDNKREQAQR